MSKIILFLYVMLMGCHAYAIENPYAFIRVKNEIKTLQKSLDSILPTTNRGVIVYNECTDGSEQVIQEFVRKYPGFKAYEYPYEVVPANSNRYRTEKIPSENQLHSYYNFALSKIPENEWLIKIDADQIYSLNLAAALKPRSNPKKLYAFAQINLHCVGDELYINKKNPVHYVGDQWAIYNKDFDFFMDVTDAHAWEQIKWKNGWRTAENLNVPCYHFKFLKPYRDKEVKLDDWIPYRVYRLKNPYFEKKYPTMVTDNVAGMCADFNRIK